MLRQWAPRSTPAPRLDRRAHPRALALAGQVRCSYRVYNAADEPTAAHSLAFSHDGARLAAGHVKAIHTFDVARPGRQYTTIPTTSKGADGQAGELSVRWRRGVHGWQQQLEEAVCVCSARPPSNALQASSPAWPSTLASLACWPRGRTAAWPQSGTQPAPSCCACFRATRAALPKCGGSVDRLHAWLHRLLPCMPAHACVQATCSRLPLVLACNLSTQLLFSPDGNYLYTGARRDGALHCWDVRYSAGVVYTLQRQVRPTRALNRSACVRSRRRLWNAQSELTNQRIYFDIEPAGRHLATGEPRALCALPRWCARLARQRDAKCACGCATARRRRGRLRAHV